MVNCSEKLRRKYQKRIMATTTIEQAIPVLSENHAVKAVGTGHQRRDLKTSIMHADEEAYQKELAAKGGKEDMWQGGDMSVALSFFVLSQST
jgi:hypothetical protein